MNEDYKRYLNSEAWKEKRKIVFMTYGQNCERCNNKGTQVHHLTYDRIFNEDIEDLMVLCQTCHELVHLHKNSRSITREEMRKSIKSSDWKKVYRNWKDPNKVRKPRVRKERAERLPRKNLKKTQPETQNLRDLISYLTLRGIPHKMRDKNTLLITELGIRYYVYHNNWKGGGVKRKKTGIKSLTLHLANL